MRKYLFVGKVTKSFLSKMEEESEDGLQSDDDDEDEEEDEDEIKDEPTGFQALSGAGAQYLSSLR